VTGPNSRSRGMIPQQKVKKPGCLTFIEGFKQIFWLNNPVSSYPRVKEMT